MTNFFNHIFDIYSKISVPEKNKKFYKLDNIVYYLADIDNNNIYGKNIYEIDIKSAFPTICHFLFEKNDSFLIKLDSITEKLEKNIFIATTLKGTEKLKQLSYISKMIISSSLMDFDPEADIFELKKDGIIYSGKALTSGELYSYYTNMGFTIKLTPYLKYTRYKKTSYFLGEDNKLIIKGIFKDRPDYLFAAAQNILIDSNYINTIRDDLNMIYSNNYFKIIKYNILDEIFIKYYLCGKSNFLNNQLRYEKIKNIITCDLLPKNYLKLFIYPLLCE